MDRDVVMKKVTGIFRDVFYDAELVVSDSTSAEDIEDWDSIMQITLIEEIERVFDIKFKLKEIVELKTVGQTVDLICSKL